MLLVYPKKISVLTTGKLQLYAHFNNFQAHCRAIPVQKIILLTLTVFLQLHRNEFFHIRLRN